MTDQEIKTNSEVRAIEQQEETAFFDFLLLMAKYKRLVLGLPIVTGIVVVVVVLLLPNWYTATTKIMPPQQSQSNAIAILGQLGALAGSTASQALNIKNPSDIYVAMLKSRTIADVLIHRFNLKDAYGEESLFETRKKLSRNSVITAGREGVITIDVDDKDPKRSAEIANAYVEELRNRTLGLAVTEAGQRRLFFEGQLKKSKDDLAKAEVELKKFTQDTGIVNPQGQVGLSVAAAAALRAQITAKEIQLTAMRSFATDSNPEVHRTQQELVGLRSELSKMEKNTNPGKGDVMIPFGKAPDVALEYTRRFRDMKYQETLFEVLSRQYEIARIDEAKDATLIQVLDMAIPPERKSRPNRALIAIISVVVATSIAVLVALILNLVSGASQRLQILRAAFSLRAP